MKIKQQWFARGFRVGHQKVFVDVDFATKTLEGWTEITVIPLSGAIDSAAFHCWQSEITNCEVDGHGASWQHVDGLQDLQLREHSSSVHQHESLRAKFATLNRTINRCDLHIRFPPAVKVTIQDQDNGQSTHNMQGSGANENGNEEEIEVATPAVLAAPMTPFGHSAPIVAGQVQYQPVTVKIWFRCVDPVLGMRFVNCDESTRFPHVYSTNSPIPCNTSLWCPCLDGIWERSTWEFLISVPKTIGSIRRRVNYHSDSMTKEVNGVIRHSSVDESRPEDITDTRDGLEMHVVCSADFVEEKTDMRDTSRKILSFAQGLPVGASHIAIAIGPFQEFILSEFREPEEDDLLGLSAVDVHAYCLPGQLANVKTTCFPVYKAMDFFVKDFGSFPFTNYQICFVDDLELNSVSAAGMSISSERLLYNERIIETIYPVTKALVVDLAAQWIGVNIVPRSWSDTWLMLGIAHFMTGIFLKKLMGNNDYRFRLKQDMVKVTEQDKGKPPLSSRSLEVPIDPRQTEFIALKASVVLHLLEQRLTRAGSTLGLGRIIPRIFLQALSGELPNGILSTEKFLKQCEKLAPVKLEEFARQWIYGYGYPKFSVVQRFNKKKMVIEMGIRQQQFQDSNRPPLKEHTFIDEAHRNMTQPPIGPVDAVFTGPLTIRIHESDGTPYEHIIELKDQFHKFDIPYNNKYRKRLRSRKSNKMKAETDVDIAGTNADDAEDDNTDVEQVHCLGNVFQAENDQETWRLEEWSKEDEDKMSGESFEWLRVDSGFEWICDMQVGQPDYMYHSQLQQDRDVVAQFEAVQYFSSVKPSAIIATILFRTVMDERYYYGIRQMAAKALARCATAELNFVGEFHLMSGFRHLYCFPDDHRIVPYANDFADIANYFVRIAFLEAMLSIRPKGYTSDKARTLFIEQLKHNDNSENAYDDSHYIAHLLDCLVESFVHLDSQHMPNLNRDRELKSALARALSEIERCQRMDRWLPSYQNLVTRTAISGKERLMQAGMLPTTYKEFMDYTREDHFTLVRMQGFVSLLNLGALRYPALAEYILFTLNQDPSYYVKHQLSISLEHGIGAMALRGRRSRYGTHTDADAMIIEEDTSAAVELRKDRESRSTIEGAVVVLRSEFREEEVVKDYMWRATNDWRAGLLVRRNLLDMCKVMFEIRESRVLKFKLPKYRARLMCFTKGAGKLVIKRGRPLEKYQKKAPVKPMKIKLKLYNSSAVKSQYGP